MFFFRQKEYKNKLETYQRVLTQREEELDAIKKNYSRYKNDMNARLMTNEATFKKLNQRWISIMGQKLIEKEKDLERNLNEIYTTQREVVDRLKKENERQNIIMRQLRHQVGKLKYSKKEIIKFKEDSRLKEDIITNYIVKIKFLESEMTKLNQENDENVDFIRKIQSEINLQKEKYKELKIKHGVLNQINRKLETQNLEKSERLNIVIEEKRKITEEKMEETELLKVKKELITALQNDLKEAHDENATLRKVLGDNKAIAEKENIAEKQKFEEIITKLREQILQDKIKLDTKDEAIKSLEIKVNYSKQELNNLEKKYEEQLKDLKDQFMRTLQCKTTVMDILEVSKNRDLKAIKDLKNQIKLKDLDLSYKEKLVNEIQKELEDLQRENGVLRLRQSEISKSEELVQIESLQKMVIEKDNQIVELKEELNCKDITYSELKQQMNDNLTVLQTEISKYNTDSTAEMSCENNENENKVSAMENILREIVRRNTVMTDLQENVQTKHDALIRIEERYQKLTAKLKTVLISITNAKLDCQGLEEENKRLKLSLRRKFTPMTLDNEPRFQEDLAATYDRERTGREDCRSNTSHLCPQYSHGELINTFCAELDDTRERSKMLGKHTSVLKHVEYLKAEIQRERKLRKKQEALFKSVLVSLQAASTCAQPDNTAYIDVV